MTFKQVTPKNSKYHRQFNPPESYDQQVSSSGGLSTPFGPNSNSSDSKNTIGVEECTPSQQKNPLIQKYLNRLVKQGLYGQPYVKDYLYDLHRKGCRPNTIRSNFSAIFQFLSYLKASGKTYLETVIREDLSGFIENEQDRDLTPNTVSTRLRSLYAFLGYLVERDIVHPNILKKKMRIKVPDALPRAIDPEDVRQFLAVIKKIRDWAMILVLLRTGMRIGELLTTRVSDVNLRDMKIDIFEAHKNRVGRVVYLSDDARIALKVWLKKRESQKPYLFYAQGRSTMTYETARAMFNKYMEKAGLSHKGYTLHCLRHTFASELLNAGMRLECVQQLLGHSSIEMTRRYARLTDITRKEEYFKAMEIIERGEIHGHYRFDSSISKVFETKKLLETYR